MLALLPCATAYSAQARPARSSHGQHARARSVTLSEGVATTPDTAFAAKKAALIAGLKREYSSFFNPMEMELYDPDVSFNDPMVSFTGTSAFKANVDMLSGGNAIGKLLFDDCGLVMHAVEEEAERKLTTRWTLQFRFKLLPWKPLAQFTGVSQYTLDADARVVGQQDYWDSVNLEKGGGYVEKPKTAGFADLLRQLKPSGAEAQTASNRELPYQLLRRAADYEVRRYPIFVCVRTEYERRLDGIGTLSSYTNGANEASEELLPYVPSLMTIPTGKWDEYRETTELNAVKVMRWPMAVPALGQPSPPKPGSRLIEYATLDVVASSVVAVKTFSDPTTEPTVRGNVALLRRALRRDGLTPGGTDEAEFRLAQFDALNSLNARRSEVWVELLEHPWIDEI